MAREDVRLPVEHLVTFAFAVLRKYIKWAKTASVGHSKNEVCQSADIF